MAKKESLTARLAQLATEWTGTSTAFVTAVFIVIIWLITGPFFGYSDTWQLVINTGTTVVTFLMVFLIQRSQNKEARATQLKLDELVHAIHEARNKFIDIEELPEESLEALQREFQGLARRLKRRGEK